MRNLILLIGLGLLACCAGEAEEQAAPSFAGVWRVALHSPGGELPFLLEIVDRDGTFDAQVINGEERIPVPDCVIDAGELLLDFPHFDSRIRLNGDGEEMKGLWTKARGASKVTTMVVAASRAGQRFAKVDEAKHSPEFSGVWKVKFASSDDPAEARFNVRPDGEARGTFLTTTGDYRFLAGRAEGGELRLSCFDGAHAFLFHARLDGEGLAGDFWSRDSWHETWTAQRDPAFRIADAFEEVKWTAERPLSEYRFPDLDGKERALDDPAFDGKARILHIFGSWCPNCHDSSAFMKELLAEYGERGLSVLGLAFELSEDFDLASRQVRRYLEHHDVAYPVLVSGIADKTAATKSLGLIDRVKSYPTTIFLHADGRLRAIHSGFTGPATGEDYLALKSRFRAIVEELLAE